MDAAFQLDEGDRSNFIQFVMQSLGSSYACLWSFSTPSSCLFYLDGSYRDSGEVQSISVFNQYKQSLFIIQPSVEKFVRSHSQVPGFAFMNSVPYFEVRAEQLPTLTSNDAQRQFYQEARIKIAVFMGCRSGEIELGFSDVPQAELEMQITNLFPQDFSRNFPIRDLPIPAENPNPPSSSSSSLRSLSMDGTEYSSLLFGLPVATPSSSQALLLTPTTTTTTTAANFPSLLARFPTAEDEHAAMTSAFFTVMTSPSLSSTTQQQLQQQQQQQQQQLQQPPRQNPWPSAFTRYMATQFKPGSSRRLNMLKRTIAYCRSMNLIRLRESMRGAAGSGSRPISTTQMHHMMSERKRREKLNDSFQSLKALLPPGTKKDKASVLAATRKYLTSLKSQVEDLRRKNAILEAQRLPPPTKEPVADESASTSSGPDQNRSRVEVNARTISDSASTSSQERIVDLQVIVRRYIPLPDLLIRILEFLKQTRNVNVLSIDSDTRVTQQDAVVNNISLRLHVEGGEWDESAFQEAVRRVVADLAQ